MRLVSVLRRVGMKFVKGMIIAGLLCLSGFAFAQDLSGWSDKTVCRLVEQQGSQEYIDEAKSRGLGCASGVVEDKAVDLKGQVRVMTSTEQRYLDMCSAFDNESVILDLINGIKSIRNIPGQYYSNIGIDLIVDLYGDGVVDASAIRISFDRERIHSENVKFYSSNQFLNVDPKQGLSFVNEQPKSKEIRKVISGDLNGDQIVDMAFIDYGEHDMPVSDGKIIFLISSPEGYKWSEMKSRVSKNIRFHTGVFIDIDNDNDLDLVAGGGPKKSWKKPYMIHVFKNDGRGNFKSEFGPNIKNTRIGGGWISFTGSDIDDDGYHDLIMNWQKPYENQHGTQIVWGKKKGLLKSMKISRLSSEHLSDKDILMDAIPFDRGGEKHLFAIYAANEYQGGTKIVDYVIKGRNVKSSELILHRKFKASHWLNTVYPCNTGMKFFTYRNVNRQYTIKPD